MKKTDVIKQLQEIAKEKAGKCLSATYLNSTTKLKWMCEKGHVFESSLTSVKRGHWCSKCSHKRTADKQRGSIEEMKILAHSKGGECLSTSYANSTTKLLWECKQGHQWLATPAQVKYGTWCNQCVKNAPLKLEDLKKIAIERGGKCLSLKYLNTSSKLEWECSVGHKWQANAGNVKNGSWCPECAEGFGERVCRLFFETLFQEKFISSWPKWLINKNGQGLQLDGYSKKLQLAFEHDGTQHSRHVDYFHKTKEQFQRQCVDDKIKDELCKMHGVILIRIPPVPTVVKISELKLFIKNQCRKNDYPLPDNFESIEINWNKAYLPTPKFEDYKTLVESKGGKLLSSSYLGSQIKLLHLCKEGHQFEMRPDSVKQGQWCPICAGNFQRTIDDMKKLAHKRGGECLSTKYIDSLTPLWWQCDKKHPKWKAPPSRIVNGGWCPRCALVETGNKKRLKIDDIKLLALSKGGKCLSESCSSSNEKLRWQCVEGHIWEANTSNIKSGRWCPKCGVINREKKRREMGGYSHVEERKIKWKSFNEAREFIHSLGLKNQDEFRQWAKGAKQGLPLRPKDIPTNPEKIYKNLGWVSMGDWIGTNRIAPQLKKYKDFHHARDWARSLKIKGEKEWRLFLRGEINNLPSKPEDVPASPNIVYKNSGWSGWGDWLGTGSIANSKMAYRSFIQARKFVHSLKLKSRTEWEKFCKGTLEGKPPRPDDIPRTPWRVYENDGGKGMDDWLGKKK